MTPSAGTEFLRAVRNELERYKAMAEGAFEQIDESDFHFAPDDESNSIWILVQHLAGNMRSRWTDFLTTDGEKPDRHRDREFDVRGTPDRAEILTVWETGWDHVFDALAALEDADLLRAVTIRTRPFTVIEAILNSVTHYANHIGQIMYIAKHRRGTAWRSLSIPRGQSEGHLGHGESS